ncbi:MAG: hypothetical protein AABX54_01320 [Nanoarchaeota archaeon]
MIENTLTDVVVNTSLFHCQINGFDVHKRTRYLLEPSQMSLGNRREFELYLAKQYALRQDISVRDNTFG